MNKCNIRCFLLFGLMSLGIVKGQDDPYFIQKISSHKESVISVAFSADNTKIVSGGEDKMVYTHTLKTGEQITSFANYYIPRGLIATQNERLIFGSGPDIIITDLNGNLSGTFKGNTTHIQSVGLAVERNRLTAGSYDKTVKLWNINTGDIEITFEGHKKNVLAASFSPDEKYVATGSLDRTVKIWNALTGEIMRSMELHSDNILDVEFHPGGNYVLSASLDNSMRLWDIRDGECIKTYIGHDKGVTDVEFLPDGHHFVSSSFDGTIVLWETFTGNKVYSFVDHTGPVNCIEVSPDGKYLVSGGVDKRVYVWKLSKKIFVDYFFEDEMEKIVSESELFLPKQKGEDKESYRQRSEKAEKYMNLKVEEYYEQYLKSLNEQQIKK